MTEPARVLVADDQQDVRRALGLLLEGEGIEVRTASSPAGVLEAVDRTAFDVLLLDLNYTRDTTSGREGLDLLDDLRTRDPDLPVVVMTAWGSVEGAVEAMRRGARDYVEKPWDNDRLLATLRTQIDLGRALRRSRRLEVENRRLRGDGDVPAMIAESRAMEPVVRMIERIGPSDAHVLVTGEPGTGKEIVARRLHAASERADGPFVAVNAGGLSEGVFDSELFGHVKGAFTDARSDRVGYFELADGGTLFLDEIGNMPAAQQAKLLRVLESGELQRVGSSRTIRVDARVISATNADIAGAVAEGAFREDLLYRLNTVEIALPPLRDRSEDVPALAAHFLDRVGRRYGIEGLELAPDAIEAMLTHPWPGNVRELEHAIERAALMADDGRIEARHLGLRDRSDVTPGFDGMTLDEVEGILVRRALERRDGNVSQAARDLGLSRSALYRRMERHELGD